MEPSRPRADLEIATLSNIAPLLHRASASSDKIRLASPVEKIADKPSTGGLRPQLTVSLGKNSCSPAQAARSQITRAGEGPFEPRALSSLRNTGVTAPDNSLSNAPGMDVREKTLGVLRAWAIDASTEGEEFVWSEWQLARGLEAKIHGYGETWPTDYDILLRGLAEHGQSLPGAFSLTKFLPEGARRRAQILCVQARAGLLRDRERHVQHTLALLSKLKLDHITKQRLNEVRATLVVPPGRRPHLRVAPPPPGRQPSATPSTSPTSPLTSLARFMLPSLPQTNSPTATFVATRPEAASVHTRRRAASAPVAVRKSVVPLKTDRGAKSLDGVSPISVLRSSGADGAQQGAALVLVGRAFAKGGYAKVRPALVLAAGLGHTGLDALEGDYVARTLGLHPKRDDVKHNLRGPLYQPLRTSSWESLAASHDALKAAGSELLPALSLRDDKENVYELVRRLDFDVAAATHQNVGLRQNPAFVRAVLDGVLPPLARMHAANFFHHDIKPENLLVDAALGRVVLADYGLARFQEPRAHPHRGTHPYRAPEKTMLVCAADLYRFGPRELTAQSDLYSLAVTIAVLVAPNFFASSPLNYFRQEEIHARRADLVRSARDMLHRSIGGAAAKTVYQRAYAMYVNCVGQAYAEWFDDRIGDLLRAKSASELHWSDTPFDRLLGAVAELDMVLASLVARGLHPDPRRRGTAASWTQTLQLCSAGPSTRQNLGLKQALLAIRHANPTVRHLDITYDNLARAAAWVG